MGLSFFANPASLEHGAHSHGYAHFAGASAGSSVSPAGRARRAELKKYIRSTTLLVVRISIPFRIRSPAETTDLEQFLLWVGGGALSDLLG